MKKEIYECKNSDEIKSLFTEAFSEKDMEKAVKLIKKLLEKKLGVSLSKMGKSERFRKKRKGEQYGLKYRIDDFSNDKLAIRLNWSDRTGGEIESVDIFINDMSHPKWTIDTKGKSIVKIIPAIIGTLEGKIDKKFVYPAEKEMPIITDIEDNEFSYGTKPEDKVNALFKLMLDTYENKGEKGFKELYEAMGSPYDKRKNIKIPEIGLVNRDLFYKMMKEEVDNNPFLNKLQSLIYEITVNKAKADIDNGIYFQGYNGETTPYWYMRGDTTQSATYKKYAEHLYDYWTKKLDEIIQKDTFLMDMGKYKDIDRKEAYEYIQVDMQNAKAHDSFNPFIAERQGWTSGISNYVDFIQNFSKLKFNTVSKQDLEKDNSEIIEKLYLEHQSVFEESFEAYYSAKDRGEMQEAKNILSNIVDYAYTGAKMPNMKGSGTLPYLQEKLNEYENKRVA